MTQPDPLLNLGFARSLQMFLEDAPSVSFERVDWYGYAANNPLFFSDPLGLEVKNNTNCRILFTITAFVMLVRRWDEGQPAFLTSAVILSEAKDP